MRQPTWRYISTFVGSELDLSFLRCQRWVSVDEFLVEALISRRVFEADFLREALYDRLPIEWQPVSRQRVWAAYSGANFRVITADAATARWPLHNRRSIDRFWRFDAEFVVGVGDAYVGCGLVGVAAFGVVAGDAKVDAEAFAGEVAAPMWRASVRLSDCLWSIAHADPIPWWDSPHHHGSCR